MEIALVRRELVGLGAVGQAGSATQTGISANVERTSSFVSASDVIPLTRTAKRSADEVEPAAAPLAPGRRAELVAELADAPLVGAFDLGRERALADARHVGLGDAEITRRSCVGPMPIPVAAAPATGFDEVTNG